ncbi:hypothetical protein ElyMa_006809700 [Elysia marginata]|uniref:Uncharacterized protein n=1 Tax=Elysia marginata TaxID=1093978 RepID=A0AAV4J4N5_9GAST|nr:hypothetical protein ElyMa_006809700 [Elysia marginata]
MFIDSVKTCEEIDIAGYRSHNLKKRIQRNYPQLKFVKPSKRNESEFTAPDQKTPKQFSKFLSARKNKEALVEFLFQHWCQASSNLLKNRGVSIAHGSFCHSMSCHDHDITVKPIEDLECDHEEADTRMLLQARHIAASSDHIIIHSPDTDVILTSLCQQSTPAMSLNICNTYNAIATQY